MSESNQQSTMKGEGKKKIDANGVEVNGIEYPRPQPPKLYKDFYEVEAIRRKRLHKVHSFPLQYSARKMMFVDQNSIPQN